MEVHFSVATERKLQELAAESGGKNADELVQDVIEGYVAEVLQTHAVLDRRYAEVKSGAVKTIAGNEVEAYFKQRSSEARDLQSRS